MPWKPRPLDRPVTLTSSPGAKISTVTSDPGASDSPTSSKLRTMWGAVSSPAFLAWPCSARFLRLWRRSPKPSCTAWSRTWTTLQGPAWMMVTGTATPSSEKTRVIPSFRPMRPLVIASPNLDLDVHAGRQIELGQRIHGLGPGVVDVEQPLVGAELELLPALLVHVRAPQHRPPLHLDRKRDGAGDLGAGLLDGADDIGRGLVEDDVVECLEADADFACHVLSSVVRGQWSVVRRCPSAH